MRVHNQYRWWAMLTGLFASLTVYGLTRTPDNYSTPIFQTIRATASLEVWALAWATVAVLAFVAAVTRRVAIWIASSMAAIFCGVSWLAGISWEAWIDGTRLSLTGWGLWAFLVCTHGMLVAFWTLEGTDGEWE